MKVVFCLSSLWREPVYHKNKYLKLVFISVQTSTDSIYTKYVFWSWGMTCLCINIMYLSQHMCKVVGKLIKVTFYQWTHGLGE